MSKVAILFCLQACLAQIVFGQQYVGNGAYVTGNSVVDNDIFINGGYGGYGGLAGLNNLAIGTSGLAASGYGGTLAVGNSGLALGSGLGLAGAGLGYGAGYGLGLGYGNAGYVAGGYNGLAVPDVAAVSSLPVTGPYIGNGFAELAVGGTLGAAGTTIVTGQIPVLGAVSFGGNIPASGVVSIAGNCGCGGLVL